MEEVIECYKTLVRGLLDLTDNSASEGAETGAGRHIVVPPPQIVRHDADDPYLVVAADKGTASFSDIANEIAIEYGFWLGDASASGGSAGYDHKAMGITSRGAGELIKRHFRELGRDIQSSDFTVIGMGDMSGDVFGNGMLQSRHTRLLAAFNHLHIFVDPNPDPPASFAERQRLFDLPRSSWADYDGKLVSPGGGVFDRSAKSLPISPEMKRVFAIAEDHLTPAELIRKLLTAEVDLLFFGGIIAAGLRDRHQRDPVLAQMAEDVAALVLRDNYLQGEALSVAEARGPAALDRQIRLIRDLERAGRLDRALEFLPDDEALATRAAARRGLTRPELAVLLPPPQLPPAEAPLAPDFP